MGLEMGITVLIGYEFGAWLDRRTHRTPLFTLIFVILGVVAGFRSLYRVARQAARDVASKEPPGSGDAAGEDGAKRTPKD